MVILKHNPMQKLMATPAVSDLTTATEEDLQQAQELSDNPEVDADPHFLLLGRLGVGKSTFAGKITGGRIQGSSGPGGGTRIRASDSSGQWRYIKTELMEEENTGQRYYVHDTVGLGDMRVDLEEMKREINEIGGSCCVFLCLSWDERIFSQDAHTAFEICSSLNIWKDVIFVITKCDLANDDDNFKSQWKTEIKDKLISMGLDGEVAENIATKQIVFSGHHYPQLRSELIDAIKNIIDKGLDQHRMKCLSLGRALFILATKLKAMEEEELQRQPSTEIGGSGIRRRRHEEHSRHSDTCRSPSSLTSLSSSSQSANDVLNIIGKYIAGVGVAGIGSIVLVSCSKASISISTTVAASAVTSGTLFSVLLASGAIVTITLGTLAILYFTGKLVLTFF